MLWPEHRISSGPYLHPTRGLLNQEGKDPDPHTPKTSSTRGRRIYIYIYIYIPLSLYIYIYTYNAVTSLTGVPGPHKYFGALAAPKPLMLVRRARANPSSTCKLACMCSLTCFCTPKPSAKSDLHVQTGRFGTILAVSGPIWSGPKCSAHRQERVAEHFR